MTMSGEVDIDGGHKKRSAVHGAPYVLCVFAFGVLLMAVGTFITTHALEEKERDNQVMIIVGPIILGLGGLLLLSSVIVCLVAFCRNSQLQEAFSDELLNIGSSTFYGGRGFAYLVNEDHEIASHNHVRRVASEGFSNMAGPPPTCNPEDEAIILLANTVAEERNRQRKYSMRYKSPQNIDANTPVEESPCGTVPCGHIYFADQNIVGLDHTNVENRYHLEHLGLEKLRRVDPYPELANDFDLGEGPPCSIRDRSASVYTRQQHAAIIPVSQRLRRNMTYTAASRARIAAKRQQELLIQQQQQQQQQQQPLEQPPGDSSPRWLRGSLHRKKKEKKDAGMNDIRIHQLPKFDPTLLNALGITPASKENINIEGNSELPDSPRGISQDAMAYPENGHGSLRHPHRRPSMGVRIAKMQQPSGSAYRHRSSIYASDMSLHRGREGVAGLDQTIGEDAYRQRSERSTPTRAYPIHSSASFTKASNSEISNLSMAPASIAQRMMNSSSWTSSSSSAMPPLRRGMSQSSTERKSSTSSNCSCRSEPCSNDSCSDCEAKDRKDAKENIFNKVTEADGLDAKSDSKDGDLREEV